MTYLFKLKPSVKCLHLNLWVLDDHATSRTPSLGPQLFFKFFFYLSRAEFENTCISNIFILTDLTAKELLVFKQ